MAEYLERIDTAVPWDKDVLDTTTFIKQPLEQQYAYRYQRRYEPKLQNLNF